MEHKNNWFELFGFDVLIDENFQPWIMEINLSPSLAWDSPLDFKIKSKLIAETFNLVGVKPFDRKVECEKKIKSRTRAGLNHLCKGAQFSKIPNPLQSLRSPIEIFGTGFLNKQDIESTKYKDYTVALSQDTVNSIKNLKNVDPNISESDVQMLLKLASYKRKDVIKDTLSEYQRKGNFERIFPAEGTDIYHKFFLADHSSNLIVHDFLYGSAKFEEEEKIDSDLPEDPLSTMNGFFRSCKESIPKSNNEHFIDLEAKLRPLRQRPDSAVNSIKFKGLSTTNDSNMSTSSTYKHNDSLTWAINTAVNNSTKVNKNEKIIEYFEGIIDKVKNGFSELGNKNVCNVL